MFQEEYDTCHNLKPTPAKIFLNCGIAKSTGTKQALYSSGLPTHNLSALWGEKNNFCGMLNVLINRSACIKEDKLCPAILLTPVCLPSFQSLRGERGKGARWSSTKECGGRSVIWKDTKRVIEVGNSSLSKAKSAWEEGTWMKMWPPNLRLSVFIWTLLIFAFMLPTKAWTTSIKVTRINSQLQHAAAKLFQSMKWSWVAQDNVTTLLTVTHCSDRTVLSWTKLAVIAMGFHQKGCSRWQLHNREDKGPDLPTE